MTNTSQIRQGISPDWKIDTLYGTEVAVASPSSVSKDYKMIAFDTAGAFYQLLAHEDEEDIFDAEETMILYRTNPHELMDYRDYRAQRGI